MKAFAFSLLLIFGILARYAHAQNITIEVDNILVNANPPPQSSNSECGANVTLQAIITGISNCAESNLLYFEVLIDIHNEGETDYLATSYCDSTWIKWTFDSTDNVFKKYILPTAQSKIY